MLVSAGHETCVSRGRGQVLRRKTNAAGKRQRARKDNGQRSVLLCGASRHSSLLRSMSVAYLAERQRDAIEWAIAKGPALRARLHWQMPTLVRAAPFFFFFGYSADQFGVGWLISLHSFSLSRLRHSEQ